MTGAHREWLLGSRYQCLCLPIAYAMAPFHGTGTAPASNVIEGEKKYSILLVDDDPELLKALTKVLEKEGYEVVAQPDAVAAIEYVNRSSKLFNLVITDVSMPKMKGTTFLSTIKTAFPNWPVIVITAFGDWGQYMEAMREGAFEYLNKPIDKNDLLASVRRAISSAKPRAHSN